MVHQYSVFVSMLNVWIYRELLYLSLASPDTVRITEMSSLTRHSSVCLHAGGGFTWSDWDEGSIFLSSIYSLSSQRLSHKHRKEHAEALDTDAIKKAVLSSGHDMHKSSKPSQEYLHRDARGTVHCICLVCTILQIPWLQ